MKGYIVQSTYRIIDGKPVVHLFGRLENGESFLSLHDFEPYFFIKKKDTKKAQELAKFEHKDTDLKNFAGEQVVQLCTRQPGDVPGLRRSFEEAGIICYEADIRFAYRFLIDNGILNLIDLDGEHTKGEFVDRIYDRPTLKPAKAYDVKLKVLSLDIETDAEGKEIFCIALYGERYRKSLIVAKNGLEHAECFDSEKEMLEAFIAKIKQIDPDIITGWNLVDFDLNVIQQRCRHHKVPYILSRDGSECKIKIQQDFFRTSTCDAVGRAVLDGINLLKISFTSLDDYKLGTAAKELIGKDKIDIGEGRDSVEKLFKKDKQKLVEYNLNDAMLVYEILEKKGIISLVLEKTLITGLPLDRARGSIAALDMLYLRLARDRGIVCPTSNFSDSDERVKGGYVMEPKFGIYENILVFDFKSLYPSIIRTFNIDPLSFSPKGAIIAPNGARFASEEGILPAIIEQLGVLREKAKKEENEPKSYAIKIIMNSFYGVLANPTCRFYSLEVANAITWFAREIVQETAAQIRLLGYDVIYGDTDSVFVVSKAKDDTEALQIAENIQEHIDNHFTKKVKQSIDRKSYLDLEFDKLYRVFLLPRIRGQEHGAKKRYAGLLIEGKEQRIDIVGLEFVRRDWTDLAKTFQMGLLERVFRKQELDSYIKQFTADLLKGKLDALLVYRKAIRKDLEDYTKTTPPHVKAARQLDNVDSSIIEYYMTVKGPEPLQKHKSKIDYEHYLAKQLKPIAESILVLLGKRFDDIVNSKGQKSLGDF